MPNRRRRQMTKKKTAAVRILMSCILLAQVTDLRARSFDARSGVTKWPTHGWVKGKPSSVGLDEKILAELDGDLASGKYSRVDSFEVIRCGREVYERKYPHAYGQIYGKEAKTRGPLNAHLTGPYNYFDPAWHPYYHGTDLHSMQSVSKTVTSVILGIAITRGDFKAGLDTPLLKYFDVAAVKNVDDRKRRITLQHVLTMTTGLDWNEEVAYDDPKNDSSLMEAANDWVQYVIDRPMAQEPGKVFNYSSGVSELLAHIFQKGTPMGVVDTEGGLFLRTTDLAKIGYFYLHDGMWDGEQIVSKDWVKQSLTPFIDAEEGFKYGFKWWLFPRAEGQRYVWMARGFGGQRLMVFPEEDLIAAFTGWDILKDPAGDGGLINRILRAVHSQTCN